MNRAKTIYGVIGGMGPLASAEFLKTIYEFSLGECEQEFPIVMVSSDPSYPDRTDALFAGTDDAVLTQLMENLRGLCALGATQIAMCCMTIHYVLPRLPIELRSRVVSLLDIIYEHLPARSGKHLVICSSGTRALKLFEQHPCWPIYQDRIILPEAADQERIHREFIYPIKKNPDLRTLTPILEELLLKYGVDSFIAGCSEIHLIAKHYASAANNPSGYYCLDPLTILAREWATGDVLAAQIA